MAQTLASYKLQLELGAEGSDAELAARAEGGDLSARLLLAKKAFGHGDVSRAHTLLRHTTQYHAPPRGGDT